MVLVCVCVNAWDVVVGAVLFSCEVDTTVQHARLDRRAHRTGAKRYTVCSNMFKLMLYNIAFCSKMFELMLSYTIYIVL